MTCPNCKTSFEKRINFCPDCGVSLQKKDPQEKSDRLNLIIAFYIVMLLFLVITFFVGNEDSTLGEEIVIESIFALLVLGFTFFDFKNILSLYKMPKIDPLLFLGVVLAPFATAFIVYYAIEFINLQLFDQTSNYYLEYAMYPNSIFWAVLFIAISPPIFEELAFRGFLFNQLTKITSARATIVLTAFIFALIHLSILSLLWIFPFGLLLGYLRHKYNTLWLGMIIHFIHNLIVVSLDYYYFDSTLLEF